MGDFYTRLTEDTRTKAKALVNDICCKRWYVSVTWPFTVEETERLVLRTDCYERQQYLLKHAPDTLAFRRDLTVELPKFMLIPELGMGDAKFHIQLYGPTGGHLFRASHPGVIGAKQDNDLFPVFQEWARTALAVAATNDVFFNNMTALLDAAGTLPQLQRAIPEFMKTLLPANGFMLNYNYGTDRGKPVHLDGQSVDALGMLTAPGYPKGREVRATGSYDPAVFQKHRKLIRQVLAHFHLIAHAEVKLDPIWLRVNYSGRGWGFDYNSVRR